ncbi:MAG: hypothetical protein R3C19_14575 [Planctomycetaceae bacterium]
MPFQSQRFIHAANVRLDVPVSVHLSEQLTEDLRHALEDATLTSFDTVIDLCISKSVDYLLLSGNLFVEADRSLRARLKLLEGFRRLQTKKIPVFVLTGDLDPPEAWRAIPELPANVSVCYSSNPEPTVLERDGRIITTVTASMWYGETDAFGIRVISRAEDGIEPFRIGIVSRAKYDESRRMASLTAEESGELLPAAATEALADDENRATADRSTDQGSNNSQPKQPQTASPDSAQSSNRAPDAAQKPPRPGTQITGSSKTQPSAPTSWSTPRTQVRHDYETGFRQYVDQLMSEGCLNYVALGGEIERSTMKLRSGIVHCPGTTQPRNKMETEFGVCTLVEVRADGETTLQEFDSSAVDWKNIRLQVSASAELNELLREMRDLLLAEPVDASDRIWSVCWTLTGPLPVLQEFLEDDIELAVAVELEELKTGGQKVRLVHQVRLLPDAWEVPDPGELGQQYADHISAEELTRGLLQSYLEHSDSLTDGWKHRFESLVRGVDRERILAQLRIDGAEWFVEDLNTLLPEPELTEDDDETDAEAETDDELEMAAVAEDGKKADEEGHAAEDVS